MQVGSLGLDSSIVCVSWNNDSNRLLVGCESGSIQIWSYNPNTFELNKKSSSTARPEKPVQFSIYQTEDPDATLQDEDEIADAFEEQNLFSSTNIFKKMWETRLANPVKALKYSPDGSLFATFSEVKHFFLE